MDELKLHNTLFSQINNIKQNNDKKLKLFLLLYCVLFVYNQLTK